LEITFFLTNGHQDKGSICDRMQSGKFVSCGKECVVEGVAVQAAWCRLEVGHGVPFMEVIGASERQDIQARAL
jgi:hypothetical protein